MTSTNQMTNRTESQHAEHLRPVVDEIMQHVVAGDLAHWQLKSTEAITKMFGHAFKRGGLDAVDGLVEDLNVLLSARGSTYLLAPGASCIMDPEEVAEALMIYYQLADGGDLVCNQWIPLETP